MANDFWADAEVISVYTRAQAILDGVLVPALDLTPDEPNFAREAGFNCHVALTATVAAIVRPTDREASECLQDVKGRLWDLLNMGRMYRPQRVRDGDGGTWLFPCIFWLAGPERERWTKRKASKTMRIKAALHAGDDGEVVATFMLPEED